MSDRLQPAVRAISAVCHGGCEEEGRIAGCNPQFCGCRRDARGVIEALRRAAAAAVEAGAIGIMNERLRQAGRPPLATLDQLYPETLLEVTADARAAWDAMIGWMLGDST